MFDPETTGTKSISLSTGLGGMIVSNTEIRSTKEHSDIALKCCSVGTDHFGLLRLAVKVS